MKCHFVARDRFAEAGNLVPMPRKVIRHNGATIPRGGFGKKVEKNRHPGSAAAFSHQTKRMLDQLRGIQMNKAFLP